MSLYKRPRFLPKQFRLILTSFVQRPGLPFANALPEAAIREAFDDEGVTFADDENAIYTPAVTLWAFLSQVLFKNEQRSCVAAVARVIVLLVAMKREPCCSNTGAYCRARGKLSESVVQRLAVDLSDGCEQQLDEAQLWHGRHVRIVDGTTVSMPDTPENQNAYPQARTQRAGLGFPVARVVVLLSLATGMVTDMAMGPYLGQETGETALLRQLLKRFNPEDILLGDRYFSSYFMIALLKEPNVDFVSRIHQLRKVDFRTESFVVVTTLTDAATYPKGEIAQLYHYRWLAELDIRAIKISMGMDILRCKTPEMVRKEMWTCLLAYNLIRQTMLQSARKAGMSPRALSFTATMQSVAASWLVIVLSDDASVSLAEHVVGNRPGRVEPRAIKRRSKPHDLPTKPRDQARAELIGEKPA